MECDFKDKCQWCKRMIDILEVTEIEFKIVEKIAYETGIPKSTCHTFIRGLIDMGLLAKKRILGKKPGGSTFYEYKNDKFVTTEERIFMQRIELFRHRRDGKGWEKDIVDVLYDWMKKDELYPIQSCIDYLIGVVGVKHFALHRERLGQILSYSGRFERVITHKKRRYITNYRKVK